MSEEQRATKPEMPVQAFQEMERRDEDQILAEIRGELVEEFVYSIQLQGKQVTNLSYAGVKEAIRRRGMFEILDIQVSETDNEIRALVRVRDLVNRIDVLGASTAPRDRPFSYVLALNKAERNAFAKLIPAKWYATLIEDWLQRHRTLRSQQGQEPAAPTPPQQPWELKVPITKEPLSQPGVRQFPLVQGILAVGMVNVLEDGSEASIIPEKPIHVEDTAITRFLVQRVLDTMVAKHPGLEYRVIAGDDGALTAILIRGKLEDSQVKELSNAARWAFSKAIERTQGTAPSGIRQSSPSGGTDPKEGGGGSV